MSKQKLTGKQALRTIKNIHLYGMETDVDENYDGEWEYTDYEEDYGSINELFPREIKAIYEDLDKYNELTQVVKILDKILGLNAINRTMIKDAYEEGWIDTREYNLLMKYLTKRPVFYELTKEKEVK